MSSSDYFAAPAPRVEEATVSRLEKVEPATVPPAAATEAATVDPVKSVEPATTMYQTTTATQQQTDSSPGDLPTKQVRGSTGSDFESYGAVIQGGVKKNLLQILLPCLYDERDFVAFGEVKYYVLVKDGLAYIYVSETDPKPLYAVELAAFYAVLEDPRNPDPRSVTISPVPNTNLPRESMKTVLLKSRTTGKQSYQFTFDTEHDATLAQVFVDLVNHAGKKDKKAKDNTKTTQSEKDEKR